MKTSEEIEEDIFKLIKDSPVASEINGGVYRKGTRPFNSNKEDIVVSFLTGTFTNKQNGSPFGLMDTGFVNINTYVPDVDYGEDVLVKDIARCKELGGLMISAIEDISDDEYEFEVGSTPQTFEEAEIHQHYVSVKLKYQRTD